MDALIIIGEPGSGKTALAEALTADLPFEDSDSPMPFRRYDCGVLELGRHREGGFSGTDALAMNVQPTAIRFVQSLGPKLLFFEGDRLSNDGFFEALQEAGYTLHIYELWGARAAAAQREARGSQQDAAWVKGRQTKVRNLRRRWSATILPAGGALGELIDRMDDPVAMALKEATKVGTA